MVNQAIVSIDVTIATQYSVFIWIDRKVQDINRNRRIYCICPTWQEVKCPLAGKSQDDGAEQSLL